MKALYIWLPVVGVIAIAFSGYLFSGLIGLTFAVVSYPLYKKLRGFACGPRGLRLSILRARNLAAFVTEFLVIAAAILGLFLPFLVLYDNRDLLVTHGLAFYGQSMDWSKVQMAALECRLNHQASVAPLAAAVPAGTGTLLCWVKALISEPASLFTLGLRTFSCLAVASVHLMVLIMIMHVSLLHGPDFWEHILEHTPPKWLVTLQRLGQRAKEVLKATYVVQVVTALAAFLVALPVFWLILGRPNFLLAAVLCGLFQLIPFLGSGFLIVGLAAYFFLEGQTTRSWECLLFAFPIVTGLADFVVRPILARSWGRISGVTMLIGLVAGIEAFGVAGFVLGPLFLELFVCFTAIMLYGPAYKASYLYPARTGLEKVD
jgi:predicted PurR-regulated permease PerM